MAVDKKAFGKSSRELLQRLRLQKIETRPLWQPNHLSLAHRDAVSEPCPVAEHLYETALSIPSSTALTDIQQTRVIEAIMGEAEV